MKAVTQNGKVNKKCKVFGARILCAILNSKQVNPNDIMKLIDLSNDLMTIQADADLNGLVLSDNIKDSVNTAMDAILVLKHKHQDIDPIFEGKEVV